MKLRQDKQKDRRVKAYENLLKQVALLRKRIELEFEDIKFIESLKTKLEKKNEELLILKDKLKL